jgi:hypothetical protein
MRLTHPGSVGVLWPDEVSETTDVMHGDAIGVAADLTGPGQQPLDQLFARAARDGNPVGEDRALVPT